MNNQIIEQNSDGQPKKKLKMSTSQSVQQYTPSITSFCNCFTHSQQAIIMEGVKNIENYNKIVSVVIRHQQKSLQTLSPQILLMFPELKQRIGEMIIRARFNINLLEQIVKDWKKMKEFKIADTFGTDLKKTQSSLMGTHSHQHSHQLTFSERIMPSQILNIFINMAKQWADIGQQTRKPIYKIIQLLQKYKNKSNYRKVVVQGSKMGRVCYEILQKFNIQSLQTYEDNPLFYLCSQYFLSNRCLPVKTYPFLANFCNNYKSDSPFTPIQIPSHDLQKLDQQRFKIIFPNFGYYPNKSKSHQYNSQTDVYISYFCTERIKNILEWIQIVYKNLKEGGLWINICFSDFEQNILKTCYNQFIQIVKKSQFKLLEENEDSQYISNISPENRLLRNGIQFRPIIVEYAKIFYFVVQK